MPSRALVVVRSPELRDRVEQHLAGLALAFDRAEAVPREVEGILVLEAGVGEPSGPACLLLYGPEHRDGALRHLVDGRADACAGAAPDDELRARLAFASHRAVETDRRRSLGYVVHDINNPLAAIRILGELLEGDLTAPESQRDVRDILEAVDTASLIAEGLSGMLRDRSDAPRKPIDLVATVRRVAGRAALREHVEVELPDTPVFVQADREALTSALTAVLYNARRLTAEGERSRVIVSATPPLVRIRSRGSIVPPELHAALLAPFGAVPARERHVPVAALGLALPERVMATHGGNLELEALPDGLEVRLRFPGDLRSM